jgi:hypothetical protein
MLALTCMAALAWGASASAAGVGGGGGGHGGGGGGGAHGFGGGAHFSGGGHYAGGRAGYAGGRGYAGYRGGYGGYAGRGGYGWRGGYGGYGWGGLGIGLYFATLPFYYSTYWAGGVPYYYADDNYYQWNGDVGEYETVTPPAEVQSQAATQSPTLMAYPKNGQSSAQQATDKAECGNWATAQSGFDPAQAASTQAGTAAQAGTTQTGTTQTGAPGTAAATVDGRSAYMRADAACLEGRGYSVQ